MGTLRVQQAAIKQQRALDDGAGTVFPLVLTPEPGSIAAGADDSAGGGGGVTANSVSQTELDPAVVEYLRENKAIIEEQLKKHGAILFRAFPLATPEQFAQFVETLGIAIFPYVGGNAVRRKVVGERVFTTNESPPERIIPFHHELAQTPSYPTRLLFFCEFPAAQGGETPILHSAEFCRRLEQKFPEFIAELERKNVVYSRVMTEHDRAESAIGRGWKSTFNISSHEELEKQLLAKGERCEWQPDGSVRHFSKQLPAVKVHNGRKVFFNQLIAAYTGWRDEYNRPEDCVRFGDGTPLDPEAMAYAQQLATELTVAFPWLPGDVLLLDNEAAMHARNTFAGPRRILASLGTLPAAQ